MSTGYSIGGSLYRNRAEAISGEIGKWTPEPIADVEAAVAELLAVGWFDASLGEVEAGEVRDGIEAHNDFLRERELVADVESDDYPIEIAEYNSAGIRAEAAACGATHMREIGRGHSGGNDDNPNSRVIFFELAVRDGLTVRVADTNGDPVWENDDGVTFSRLAEECGVDLDEPADASPPTLRALVREQISRRARQAATHQHHDNYWRLDVYRDGSLSWQESVSDDEQTIDEEADGFAAIPTLAYVGTGSCKCNCEACNNPEADDPEFYDHSDAVEWIERDMERALDEIAVGYFEDEDEDEDEDEEQDPTAETSTFAVVDLGDGGTGTIVGVYDLTDIERDHWAREHGRRLVHLPGGGEVGDRVTIDEDGVAAVAPKSED